MKYRLLKVKSIFGFNISLNQLNIPFEYLFEVILLAIPLIDLPLNDHNG
jgi:hypothetical protein